MKIIIGLVIICIASSALAGDNADLNLKFRWKSFPSLSKEECLERGGKWRVLGMPGAPYPPQCNLQTKDAGKPCKNPEDCEGYCLYNSLTGDKVTGVCSEEQKQIGCREYIQDGQVLSICSD
jgi:hypothetical protein